MLGVLGAAQFPRVAGARRSFVTAVTAVTSICPNARPGLHGLLVACADAQSVLTV
jgi:hypothetical protein